jgi:hypothetical protein
MLIVYCYCVDLVNGDDCDDERVRFLAAIPMTVNDLYMIHLYRSMIGCL